MKSLVYALGIAIFILGLTGCEKPPVAASVPVVDTLALVPAKERSAHFEAVNRHLELGGALYGYLDIDGDVLKLAAGAHQLLESVAVEQPMLAVAAQQDLGKIFQGLGLTDIKAVGVSSVPDAGGGFRNRAFFYTPEGRHGLMAAFGGAPGPFQHLGLAPANTDYYIEVELDAAVVYEAVRAVLQQVGGDALAGLAEAQLKQVGHEAGLAAYDIIQAFKGRVVSVLRLEDEQAFQFPGKNGLTVPAFSLLMRVDGMAGPLAPALGKLPMLCGRELLPGFWLYEMAEASSVKGLQPVIALKDGALFVASSQAFLDECLAGGTHLADDATFQRALAVVGAEGNGLHYATPRLFSRLRELPALNAGMPAEQRRAFEMVASMIPQTSIPVITLRSNLPDGLLVQGHWHRSMKQELVMGMAYNPVTIGLMAAMAIPAFQKVRASSQEKAIINNLRQLEAAAEQYYLENGVDTTTYDKLVGPESDKYIRKIESVAGEIYTGLRFKMGQPLRVRTKDGRTIQYPR